MHRRLVLAIAAVPFAFMTLRPASPSLIWWTTTALEKVRPYDSAPEKLKDSVHLFAARNEFEPFQIVLRAESQEVDEVDIEVSDLEGPGGAVLARKNISIYFERFLDLPKPSSIEGLAGEWPDALIPRIDAYFEERRNAFPFPLTDRRNQPIWIEIYVPPSTPPGAYRGSVTISSKKSRIATVPVVLDVWKFNLPSTSSLPNSFGFNGNTALRQHLGTYTSDSDLYRFTYLYRKAALWHRLSLHGGAMAPPAIRRVDGKMVIDWKNYDAEIGPFLDGTAIGPAEPLAGAKATSIDLRKNFSLTSDEEKILYLRSFASHFREKGWLDRLFYYLADEPKPKDYPKMMHEGHLVHSADPGLKNLVASPPAPVSTDTIDIWTPLVNCLVPKTGFKSFCNVMMERSGYTEEIEKGNKLWWYQSCASHGCDIVGGEYFRGWPSYVIDNGGIANRIMSWLTWKYDVQGEFYYNINEAYSRKTDAWTDIYLFGGNGDGTLVYPGRPRTIGGKTDIPIESIRLKLIRESLEDYEYLFLLSKYSGPAAAASFVDRLVTNAYTYERDPEKFYEVRRKIGELVAGKVQ